jgi:hypothetical protein
MSPLFWIAVASAFAALVVGLILRFRASRENQVWEELVDPSAATNSAESARDPNSAERHDIDMDGFTQPQVLQDEEMNNSSLSQSQNSGRDADLRRSTRLERPVSLIVLGTNRRGEIFQERTSAVSVNLHGCRYSSRHEYAPEGWVTLQVTGTDGGNSHPIRARVRSVFSPQTTRELCQVGVELENPGNIWGIPAPPEDWQRLLGSDNSVSRVNSPMSQKEDSLPTLSQFLDRQSSPVERKPEVTVFPGPPSAAASSEEAKENLPGKSERVVVTAEQLLQGLQGKIQPAAEKAVQTSLSAQIDDSVKAALGRIEDGWKANVQRTEEFSAMRMAEARALWENELNSYRDRAEEVARRIEALTSLAQKALGDSQRFVERFAAETVPQLEAKLDARAADLSAQHAAQLNENAQRALSDARAQLDGTLAQAQPLAVPANAPKVGAVTQEQLESQLALFRTETLERLEKRLSELSTSFGQQVEAARNHTNGLAQQMEGLALESRQARAQHEQGLADMRSQVSNVNPGIPQEQLNAQLNSTREQILSHLEWRLGEVSGHFDQLAGQHQNRANELAQQVEKIMAETRDHLAEARSVVERNSRGLVAQDLATIEQSVGHATREFENAAARVSDRQLIRMMEQKQVVTREASLELEARATEARAVLQKTSNSTIDEFRNRVESHVDQILAETNERFASSFASLDAECQATVEARRRALEADVARAAEQSTMEFRSGIKAFLYSCLVAAVSAVDQHASTTLAGLSSDPKSAQRALDAITNANSPASTDNPEFPRKAASTSSSQ